MRKKTYIHYGSDHFNKEMFIVPVNGDWGSKPVPHTGLWASPIDSDFGWMEWCIDADFNLDKLLTHFKFTLSDRAKVLFVNKLSDVDNYVSMPDELNIMFRSNSTSSLLYNLDFEQMIKDGYDAIELSHEDNYAEIHFSLFNTWDCDSILILNPDIIEEIK